MSDRPISETPFFLLCAFWLAQAHATAGDLDRARAVFDLAVSVRNDVGLLAEEYDDGELLGNFPRRSATWGWWPPHGPSTVPSTTQPLTRSPRRRAPGRDGPRGMRHRAAARRM